jgi:hypothetical protein
LPATLFDETDRIRLGLIQIKTENGHLASGDILPDDAARTPFGT